MSIKYGFFNSVNGDRLYNAEDIGRYLHGLVSSSGVYADSDTSLQVLANGGLAVEVQPGRGMLDYHYMENNAPLVLTLAAGGSQARVDAIVMRLDMNERLCEIAVKEGTPAAAPVAPTMYRSDAKKEYMLASVRIPALASSITQDNITDTRADKSVCGWMEALFTPGYYTPTINGDSLKWVPSKEGLPTVENLPISLFKDLDGVANEYVWVRSDGKYVNSPDPNAYPPAVSDGYTYSLLGQIGGAARIVTGSYTGTGKYGASNPNSLTFDFEPKIVMLTAMVSSSGSFYWLFGNSEKRAGDFAIDVKLLTTSYQVDRGFSVESSDTGYSYAKKDGKTVYWYDSTKANRQGNNSGFTYHYMAIG